VTTCTTGTYGVTGMTCEHCVRAVTDELAALPGVRDVSVELVAGGTSRVQVVSDAPLADSAVSAAVGEAGYSLAGTP
jgi:copper chaperone